MTHYPLYLAGAFKDTSKKFDVRNPYDDSLVATVAEAGTAEIDTALAAAEKAFEQTRMLEPFERSGVLRHIANRLTERQEEFAKMLSRENGKTIREARAEVGRAISTFQAAEAEVWTHTDETFDAGITAAGKGRRILVRRFPAGIVSAIAPFNFPLNLSAHKIAPAIAVGCPVVLKPASRTPVCCLMLAEIIAETAWPKGAFSCLPCGREAGQMLVEDPRIAVLSFTGSTAVGWKMKRDAGKKRVVLELGGNAGLIVDRDISDWNWAVSRTVTGAFTQAGQSCISVQRIFVHQEVYDEYKKRVVEAVKKLKVGDPSKEDTDVGPLVDAANADRVAQWIDAAVKAGATLLCGGKKTANAVTPALLENVPADQPLSCDEAFGPVAILERVASMDEAVTKVNDSRFGLQCGVISNDFAAIQRAFNRLHVGGVIVNDVPSFRMDHMPYGGIKDSGLGREGIRYAMRDMLEEKAMVYFSAY